MNILLLNLTRFGDLLQSAGAVRALARGKGGEKNRLGVVCLENFTAGAAMLPELAAIYPLPAAHIMKLCAGPFSGPFAESGDQPPPAAWLKGLERLHHWVAMIREDFAPDCVCNLSPSTPASLLARLLAGEGECTGFTLDAFGFSRATSLWAAFVQGSSAVRATSPFNIVDLFRNIALPSAPPATAALLPVPEAAIAAATERLTASLPSPPAGFVALQLGASADIRRWPVASFAKTGDALWRSMRLAPILLGTQAEQALGEEYAALAAEPHINLMGQTGLAELAAALCACRLCISNDTGTLHLASGLGVPVLGLFLATAQPWDTGPYAAGNCALEPDLACHPCAFGSSCPNKQACHSAITPQTVIALAQAKAAGAAWQTAKLAAPESFAGARVWESSSDAGGFADLLSLSGHEDTPRTRWMRLQRSLYRHFFAKTPGSPFVPPLHEATLPRLQNPETAWPDPETALARACDEALALFDALLQQAEMLAKAPIAPVQERFTRSRRRLAELFRAHSAFTAIGFCWQTESLDQTSMEAIGLLIRQYRAFFAALREHV